MQARQLHTANLLAVCLWCLESQLQNDISHVLSICMLQHPDRAEEVLSLCRRLWGQPYIAPVYGLLLHRWLLLHTSAGGQEQRQKHVNVLISGQTVTHCLVQHTEVLQ